MPTAHVDTPLTPFEEVIDGYFPLQVSLAQMLERLGVARAYVEITHAPIMQIPGLAYDAPVPLNIRAGRAGMIDRLRLRVAQSEAGVALSGKGRWRWLDGRATGTTFDPMTRLAEPAFLRGGIVMPAKRQISEKALHWIADDLGNSPPLDWDPAAIDRLGDITFDPAHVG